MSPEFGVRGALDGRRKERQSLDALGGFAPRQRPRPSSLQHFW
jgi:hypothetical protein